MAPLGPIPSSLFRPSIDKHWPWVVHGDHASIWHRYGDMVPQMLDAWTLTPKKRRKKEKKKGREKGRKGNGKDKVKGKRKRKEKTTRKRVEKGGEGKGEEKRGKGKKGKGKWKRKGKEKGKEKGREKSKERGRWKLVAWTDARMDERTCRWCLMLCIALDRQQEKFSDSQKFRQQLPLATPAPDHNVTDNT